MKPMTKEQYRNAKEIVDHADRGYSGFEYAMSLQHALAWMEAAKPLLERLNDIDHISTHDLEVVALLETLEDAPQETP
jgi:hypothetical protein